MLDPSALVSRVADECARGVAPALVAAGFHEAIGRASASLAGAQARARGLNTVALTGGVFQNLRLTEVVETELVAAGITVLVHREIPPNDGGISIGQAAVAAYRTRS